MEQARLYDTNIVIKMISKEDVSLIPGAITIYTAIEYPPSITKAREILYPDKDDYALAVKWQTKLRNRGTPLPAIDLIVAAIGYNRGYIIITSDKHFTVLKDVEKDVKILIQ